MKAVNLDEQFPFSLSSRDRLIRSSIAVGLLTIWNRKRANSVGLPFELRWSLNEPVELPHLVLQPNLDFLSHGG
jgi:hypothetical protein